MSQRPGTPFDRPGMGTPLPIPFIRTPQDRQVENLEAKRELEGKVKRMAGDALRTAFGGGAITGESADRRMPTEEMVIGNPMDAPMAADQVKMPQDLQAGYLNLARFGSPLPIHGLGTPSRTSLAQSIQDQNFAAYHQAILGARNPVGMMRVPFGMGGMK